MSSFFKYSIRNTFKNTIKVVWCSTLYRKRRNLPFFWKWKFNFDSVPIRIFKKGRYRHNGLEGTMYFCLLTPRTVIVKLINWSVIIEVKVKNIFFFIFDHERFSMILQCQLWINSDIDTIMTAYKTVTLTFHNRVTLKVVGNNAHSDQDPHPMKKN